MKTRSPSSAGRFAIEIFVVFIGVYGAFWLDGYRVAALCRERAAT